jgi:hypothetical protein
MEIDRIVLGIGAAGHVAHRAGQRAEAIKRALRPLKNFDVIDVEQLEVEIERHFAQIDAHRELALAPFTEESLELTPRRTMLPVDPGPVSTTVMPGVKAASP